MAKNSGSKGPAKRQQPESDDEASDDESEDENFLSLQGKKRGKADSDDEKERAVFDLNLDQVPISELVFGLLGKFYADSTRKIKKYDLYSRQVNDLSYVNSHYA